jgi:hypothetical protein
MMLSFLQGQDCNYFKLSADTGETMEKSTIRSFDSAGLHDTLGHIKFVFLSHHQWHVREMVKMPCRKWIILFVTLLGIVERREALKFRYILVWLIPFCLFSFSGCNFIHHTQCQYMAMSVVLVAIHQHDID